MSPLMVAMLQSVAAGKPTYHAGGKVRTAAALKRRGYISISDGVAVLTENGRAALAAYDRMCGGAA